MAKECRQRPFAAYFNAAQLHTRFVIQDRRHLLQSWPWWIALGVITVPFTAQLRLLEWSLFFPLLLLLYYFSKSGKCALAVLMLYSGGIIWGSAWGGVQLSSGLPDELTGRDCQVTGVVATLPEQRERSLRIRFRVEETHCQGQLYPFTGDILLNWYRPHPQLEPGQRWRLTVRLKPASGSLNPGAFNYQQWLFAQGINVTAYVRDSAQAQQLETLGHRYAFERYRGSIQQFILSQGLDSGGLIIALATGIRSGLSDAQWQVFRRTGTAHLVAISGLHIGMVAALGYLLGLWLWRYTLLVGTHYPAPSIARLVSLLLATFYAGLAGFTLPTTRALLMLLVYFVLLGLRRNPGLFFVLGLVLLSVLLFDPMAPLGGGFWLSFGAVLAIAIGTRSRGQGTTEESPGSDVLARWQHKLAVWWRVQWSVTLGLAPVTLFLFHQLPLLSLPANLLAIPVVAILVVPAILLAILFLMLGLPLLSTLLLEVADILLEGLWLVLQMLSQTEFAVARLPVPQTWELLLAVLGFILLVRSTLGAYRWMGMLFLMPLFIGGSALIEEGAFRLEVLDVGQGLAVLVRTRHHALLYDAGVSYPDGFDAGRAIVLPFLRQQGVASLDAVVASHDNADHVGGMAAVLEQFPAAARYASAAFYPGSRSCEQGQAWHWDGVELSFVHPQRDSTGSGNDHSCVLRIRGRFGGALLTGDIERAAEQKLLGAGDMIQGADIVLVPHHGSRSSSSSAFVRRLDARLALVSAGYMNRFGHPHADVVQRYRDLGVKLLNTADSGWISVSVSQTGVMAQPYRSVFRRYWLAPDRAEQAEPIYLPPLKPEQVGLKE